MLEPAALIIAVVTIFAAGIIQSMTGFGFGLVAVPLLSIFISPKLAVPIIVVNSIVLNMIIVSRAHQHVDLKRIWPLMLAGVTGVPLGAWMLISWDVDVLRVYIGAATILFTLVFLRGFNKKVEQEKLAFVPIGFVSGVMSGSINMAGPPVILFFTNQGIPRQIFRASIVAYFLVLTLCSAPLFAASGILTIDSFKSAVLLFPGLIVGGVIGTALARKVQDNIVRRITLLVVMGAGVMSILNGLGVF